MQQVDGQTLDAVRKVIAVHLNYPSRASQRGRTPDQPSYFLKPPSSLALSGSAVERPAGCELLGFEGEIALIIGTPARGVAPERAWSHVQWVTASNDLGAYDLRYADKGLNLRSKGGDGFTPIGPGLISAASVDPAALRIRTWHNGEAVQDDTTQDLLFPFARLVTRVEEGMVPLAGFGAQPKADDLQREEAYGSRRAAGLPEPAPTLTLTPEVKAKLETVATATLSSQLRRRGLDNVSIDGLRATRPDRRVGHGVNGLHPMDAAWRARYEEYEAGFEHD